MSNYTPAEDHLGTLVSHVCSVGGSVEFEERERGRITGRVNHVRYGAVARAVGWPLQEVAADLQTQLDLFLAEQD